MRLFRNVAVFSLSTAGALADGLHARAKAVGRYMGSEFVVSEMSITQLMQVINNPEEIGSVVPGNEMKWDATEPQRGRFNYGGGDRIAQHAKTNNKHLRCHALVWHSQLPSWVSNSGFDNATLISVMQSHITNVMTHWKGQCNAWDVVNEALEEDGRYRNSVFYRVIGEAFLPIAFRTAASVDPNVKLYYNDYNIDLDGPKSKGAIRIVNLIKSWGVKIDGVGFQAHLISGEVGGMAGYKANLDAFVKLGVEVAYTELDIRMKVPSNQQQLNQQGTDYYNVVLACATTPKCVGVTTWGITDSHSWVGGTFPGTGEALPWNGNYQKKPAYYGILYAFGNGTAAYNGSNTAI